MIGELRGVARLLFWLLILFCVLAKSTMAESVTPEQLIAKVSDAYRSLKTYKDKGVASAPDKDHPPSNFVRKFTTYYAELFRFKQEWQHTQALGLCSGNNLGAVWHYANEFHHYSECGSYGSLELESYSSFIQLIGYYGARNKYIAYVLGFLMQEPGLYKKNGRNSDAEIVGEDYINGFATYVAIFTHYYGGPYKVKYWIDKDSFLIRKYEAPAIGGGVSTVELTDIAVNFPLSDSDLQIKLPKNILAIRKAKEAMKNGGIAEAQEILSRDGDVSSKEIQVMLAMTYFLAGNKAEALKWAEKAAENCEGTALKIMTNQNTKIWGRKSRQCYGYGAAQQPNQ